MAESRRQRILVIARGHLGDMVGALPAFRDLRAGYQDAHITVIANEYVSGLLERCPYVDQVIYGFAYRPRPTWRSIVSRLGLVPRIAGRYDIALCLRMSPRWGSLLGLLSGARIRVGYRKRGLPGRLLTHDLGPEPRLRSNRLTNADVIRPLGLEPNLRLPRLDWLDPAERRRAEDLLAENGVGPRTRFAVCQIATHWGCYEWRSEKWAALADHLSKVHDMKVVMVGAGEAFEKQKFGQIAALSRAPVSIQGKTTIPMLIHIVSRASLVVSTDSALTQVALAQRVPAVIMFGIEPSVRNGPLREEVGTLMESIQYWEGEGRAPAPNPNCRFGQNHCHTDMCCENSSLRRIEVDEVCHRVDRILQRVGMVASAR